MAKTKKSLDKILSKSNSWKRVLKIFGKYLKKYGSWSYIYEYDCGSIKVSIIPIVGKGKKSQQKQSQEAERPAKKVECKLKME